MPVSLFVYARRLRALCRAAACLRHNRSHRHRLCHHPCVSLRLPVAAARRTPRSDHNMLLFSRGPRASPVLLLKLCLKPTPASEN